MRKALIFLLAMAMSVLPLAAQGENHGALLNWTASTSAATCLSTGNPPCTGGYQIFEGPSIGNESSTPLNSTLISGTSYADNGPYLGTTRCWTVQYQWTVGTVTSNSVSSNEACFTWPSQPAPPGQVVVVIH